ncbi:MAG: helix-turn-helix domain-containing protein [Bacteroidota bacterium]
MELSKLHIKNMVCPRCVMVVKQTLEDLNIGYNHVKLGEVELDSELNSEVKVHLAERLEKVGFSLIDDRKSRMIDQIKHIVIDQIQHPPPSDQFHWAEVIAGELHYDYKYLSSLFSSVEGITLEQYIIRQKIERIKELIVYDEMTLSQIAYQLKYSSVAHLSGQFKKETGMSPSVFKQDFDRSRSGLDSIGRDEIV